jgi:hypothetical protein
VRNFIQVLNNITLIFIYANVHIFIIHDMGIFIYHGYVDDGAHDGVVG